MDKDKFFIARPLSGGRAEWRDSWQIIRNQWTRIEGPNGSGKTTRLMALAGISLEGQKVEWEIEPSRIYYAGSELGLDLSITVSLYLRVLDDSLGLQVRKSETFQNAVRKLGFEKLMDSKVETLSSGEKQRLLVIKGYIFKPDLWILDETLSKVDDAYTAEVRSLLASETVLWVQHHG